MNHYIFSPLAVVCALSVLYSSPNHASDTTADLNEEFFIEELPLEIAVEASTPKEPLATSEEEKKSYLNEDTEENFFAIISPKETEVSSVEESDHFYEVDDFDEEFLSFERESEEEYEEDFYTEPSFSAQMHRASLADPLLLASSNPASLQIQEIPENDTFISIGGTYTYTHIKPEGHTAFSGNLGGVQGLFEYRPCHKLYTGFKLSWRQGETKSPHGSRFLVDATAEERIGYTFADHDDKWLWTLFTGVGYRFLGHHLKQSGNNLRFNYSEFYCPVGLFTDYQFAPSFSWGLHATWMPQIFPTVTIVPLGGARWGTSYSLGNALIEMPFSFFTGENKHFFLTITPSFQYWQDGHSVAKTSTGEKLGLPQNTYFFWGADLNLGYAF